MLAQIYAALLPLILTAIGGILSYVIGRAAEAARARWGIEIEARHREALHSALMTGIQAALGRGLVGQAAIDAATVYAAQSVPDALARLDPDSGVLAELARSKLRAALDMTPVFAVGGSAVQGDNA